MVFVLSSLLLNKQFVVDINKAWGALPGNTCMVVHLLSCRSEERLVFCIKQILVFSNLWRRHEVRGVSLWPVLSPPVFQELGSKGAKLQPGREVRIKVFKGLSQLLVVHLKERIHVCQERKRMPTFDRDTAVCAFEEKSLSQGWGESGASCFWYLFLWFSLKFKRQFDSSMLCLTNIGR